MPSKVVEIVLITLILFFVYLFSIRFFTSFPIVVYYERFLVTYLKNNVIMCATLGSIYYGKVYCNTFFEDRLYGRGFINAIGESIYISFGSQVDYLNISKITPLKRVYGISNVNFYIYNNVDNLTISHT